MPGEGVTIGRALPGYQAYVLDEQLTPVGPGSEGELFIGGAGVALGYLNRPDLTAERFIDNPFSYLEGPPDFLDRNPTTWCASPTTASCSSSAARMGR